MTEDELETLSRQIARRARLGHVYRLDGGLRELGMCVRFDDYPPYWQLSRDDRREVYRRSGEIVAAMLGGTIKRGVV